LKNFGTASSKKAADAIGCSLTVFRQAVTVGFLQKRGVSVPQYIRCYLVADAVIQQIAGEKVAQGMQMIRCIEPVSPVQLPQPAGKGVRLNRFSIF